MIPPHACGTEYVNITVSNKIKDGHKVKYILSPTYNKTGDQ